MRELRLAAIAFAVFSTFYWMVAAMLWELARQAAADAPVPYWRMALPEMAPPVIYGVLFCHWLARRAYRAGAGGA